MKIMSQSHNGRVFLCNSCSKIHIEYKNINLNFSEEEFDYFRKYFANLDAEYWHSVNDASPYRRKIIVPVGHKNINLLFDTDEIAELRDLLNGRKRKNGAYARIPLSIQLDSIVAQN